MKDIPIESIPKKIRNKMCELLFKKVNNTTVVNNYHLQSVLFHEFCNNTHVTVGNLTISKEYCKIFLEINDVSIVDIIIEDNYVKIVTDKLYYTNRPNDNKLHLATKIGNSARMPKNMSRLKLQL